MTKPDIVRAWCAQRVGCPYIYGATGQPCTPAYRKARAAQYPAYAAKIERNCLRLSGKAASCAGCRWADPATNEGRPAYDCAQLSRRAMEAVGIPMVSGANSQWERTQWAESGTINNLPADRVCLVFRWDADKNGMGHVGVYQGDGTVIHARGHDWGVMRQNIGDVRFTHWGIPAGLYDGGEIDVNHPILRRGDSGESVAYLQTLLSDAVVLLKPDGLFGANTEAAVRTFQRAQGIRVDGVVGPVTWAALEKATGHAADHPAPAANDTPTQVEAAPDAAPKPEPGGDVSDNCAGDINAPNKPDTVTISRDDWNAIRAAVAVLYQAVKKSESVG